MLLSAWTLLWLLLLHLLFLSSVFDIYFRSPVLTDIDVAHKPDYDAPARRLILMVADGLRAEAFFNSSRDQAPFLHEMGRRHGAVGVAHTRVPTESRPGHVAMIAGMYEDPSAITRGWSENPVEFDTLFNQSRRTWAWGSPDILPMFSKAVEGGRMRAEWYSHKEEDLFGQRNLSLLDTWVFDRVEEFFAQASKSDSLRAELREDKVVLFLHLLGLDSNGHVNKPHSEQYHANIAVVDAGVRRVAELARSHWRSDDRTAFVFTADHGMTDWGSHGTGMAHETEVPLVAWGAGVAPPEPGKEGSRMFDLEQADIAPLMSSLLGVAVPKNSAGRLPWEMLSLPPQAKVEAATAVARQAFQMLATHRRRFEKRLIHRPFDKMDQQQFDEVLQLGKHKEALMMADALAETAREGVEYYQGYFRVQLFTVVSLTYLGFIVWILLDVMGNFSPLASKTEASFSTKLVINVCSATGFLLAAAATLTQAAPTHFVLYFAAPVIIWRMVAMNWASISWMPSSEGGLCNSILNVITTLLTVESMVAAFFDRRVLSAAVVIVTLWQTLHHRSGSGARSLKVLYVVCSIGLCAFTFQPTIGKDHNNLLVLFSSLLGAAVTLTLTGLPQVLQSRPTLVLVSYLPLSGMCVILADAWSSSIAKYLIHAVSWTIFVTSIPISFFVRPLGMARLLHVALALQSAYTLLSLSYESLFLLCLSGTLASWLELERTEAGVSNTDKLALSVDRPKNVVDWRDAFRSLLFVFYSVVSFFGTGNIASLNSFDPRSIRCLVSVFNPFLMGGILLGKILIPFLLVAAFFYLVRSLTRMQPRAFLLTMVLLADVMGLHFFFLVTNRGSWLDIGSSLSRFVIAEGTAASLSLLLALAGGLLSCDPLRIAKA